jgi:tRNA(fMet)-specific endonuclease VapC
MPAYMLDTDTVSFALRGVTSVTTRVRAHRPSELCASAITLAELRFGADRRGSRRLHKLLDTFFASVVVVPFDDVAALSFGKLGAALAGSGTPIGQLDTLIAAHALALNLILVTNNTKHFSKVKTLRTENWNAEA